MNIYYVQEKQINGSDILGSYKVEKGNVIYNTAVFKERDGINNAAVDGRWLNGSTWFFDFMAVQYAFSRNHTSNFELWPFSGLALYGMISWYWVAAAATAPNQPHDHSSKQETHLTILSPHNHSVFDFQYSIHIHALFNTLV